MTRFDSDSGCTRRQVVKALGLAGAGALASQPFLSAQAAKRGKIDVHSHTRPPGPAHGKAAPWMPETTIEAMDKYGISVSILSAINGSRDPFYSGKPEFPFGALRNFVPNSQILFGTDYPAQPIASTTDPIPMLGLSAANLQGIHSGNAVRLFPRLKTLLS